MVTVAKVQLLRRQAHLHYMNKAALYAECELQAYLRMEDTFFIVLSVVKSAGKLMYFFG